MDYHDETASPTANLIDKQILINSTISDAHKGAHFMGLDINDFFLMTPLPKGEQEYMRIHSWYFDKEIIKLYKLHDMVNKDGYIYSRFNSEYTS